MSARRSFGEAQNARTGNALAYVGIVIAKITVPHCCFDTGAQAMKDLKAGVPLTWLFWRWFGRNADATVRNYRELQRAVIHWGFEKRATVNRGTREGTSLRRAEWKNSCKARVGQRLGTAVTCSKHRSRLDASVLGFHGHLVARPAPPSVPLILSTLAGSESFLSGAGLTP
jgi:hypothetical protein